MLEKKKSLQQHLPAVASAANTSNVTPKSTEDVVLLLTSLLIWSTALSWSISSNQHRILQTDTALRPCIYSTMGGVRRPTAHVSLHCATSKYEHMCNAPSFCSYCTPPGCCCTLGSQLAWLNHRNISHLLNLNKKNQVRHSWVWLSEE